MVRQAVKQDARRTVREALDARRKQRLETERRQAALAVTVLTALAERDAAIAAADLSAAAAVQALCSEGLELADVATLCGQSVPVKELQRLAKLPVLEAAGQAS